MTPMKPKKPCSFPGCPELTDGGRCERHRRQARQEAENRRLTAAERGYDHRWSKIRDMKLNENPLCERCEREGRDVAAVLVHHKDRNPKNNDFKNLESLCDRCHDAEHVADVFRPRGGAV